MRKRSTSILRFIVSWTFLTSCDLAGGHRLKAAASAGGDHAVIVGKDEPDAELLTLRDISGGAQESLSIEVMRVRPKTHFRAS